MKNRDFKIVKNHKLWFVISLCIITVGVIVFSILAGVGKDFKKGLNLGVDFTGGSQIDVEIGSLMNDDNKAEIKKVIGDTFKKAGIKNITVQSVGDNEGYTVIYRAGEEKTDLVLNGKRENNNYTAERYLSLKGRLIEAIEEGVQINSAAQENSYSTILINSHEIAPKFNSSVILYVLLSVLGAWVLVMLYAAFRFEFSMSLTASAGLLHDVLVIFALMAITRIQLNLAFIGVLIALVCYSLYNTFVVFDKLRENARKESMKDSTASDTVDKSIQEIFRRVMYTTIAFAIIPVVLFIAGGIPLMGVAGGVLLSLIVGTYSSMFIVPSMWAMYKEKQDKKGKREYFRRKSLFKRTEKTESNIMENQKDE